MLNRTGDVTRDRGKGNESRSALPPLTCILERGRFVLIAFRPSGRGKDRVFENVPLGSVSDRAG